MFKLLNCGIFKHNYICISATGNHNNILHYLYSDLNNGDIKYTKNTLNN